MIKTSTSVNHVNYAQQKQETKPEQEMEANDLIFYESIKPQLDSLIKSPSDEVIARILAYAKA